MSVIRIADFDTWRPGYGQATVRVLQADSSNLASVYSDEELTVPVANPQTLLEKTLQGISYGKFAQPVYIGVPYQLEINSVDGTGIIRPPIDTLVGQDASEALVKVSGGEVFTSLADRLVRTVDVRDYGEFKEVGALGASAATNNATLVSAIGVVGAAGGGFVEIPEGNYSFTTLSLPQGVVLRGRGQVATTLQSLTASAVISLSGARAGLGRLTIDGFSQVTNSVGINAVAIDNIYFDDCEIKRFDTGIYLKGGSQHHWDQLYVSDCRTGTKLHGDVDAGNGSTGSLLEFIDWRGGAVALCSVAGVDLRYIDRACSNICLSGVFFDTNTGTAVKIIGAHAPRFLGCHWLDNTIDLDVTDNETVSPTVHVIDLLVADSVIEGGDIDLTGALENTAFRRTEISGVDVTLTTPTHNILVEDCRETAVTLAGVSTAWTRRKTTEHGASSGLTTGNAATKAWGIALAAGQAVKLEAKVIGRQRNGTGLGFYHITIAAYRPGAALQYDTQTGNFTLGNVVTGATSGATGRIIADADGGTAGTLTLQDVTGTFVDNEALVDGAGGAALANGTQTLSNAVLKGTNKILSGPTRNGTLAYDGQTGNFAVGEIVTGGTSGATGTVLSDADGGTTGTLTLTDASGVFADNEALTGSIVGAAVVNGVVTPTWGGAAFVANGPEIELRVTGASSQTIEWTVDVEVVSS